MLEVLKCVRTFQKARGKQAELFCIFQIIAQGCRSMGSAARKVIEDDVMQNMLQQLNWALLLSRGTNNRSLSHHYRKAWRRLLTTILNIQDEFSGGGLSEKLEVALARLHHSNGDYDSLAVTSLREFACAIEAQSGKRIRPADANTLVNATQEIIDVLMSGWSADS